MSLTNEEVVIGTNELSLFEIVVDYSLIYLSIARSRIEHDDAIEIVAETFISFLEEGRHNESQAVLEEKLNQCFFNKYCEFDEEPNFDLADLDGLFGIFRDNPVLQDYFSSSGKSAVISDTKTQESDNFSDIVIKEMANLSRHQQDKSILALFQLVLDFYHRRTPTDCNNLRLEISEEINGI